MEKKGQIEVTFNWIYIVIAGAVILLFFTGLVIKQKAASEERLAVDVVNILESIFSGAEVSENTKNFVETGALADEIIYFSCEDGIGEYGLEGYSYGVQNTVDPIFSPGEIKSPLLILWSIPYYLPFQVMDFLIVTSSNTKYYFIGESEFKEDLQLALGEEDFKLKINAEFDESEINEIEQGNNFQVRLIYLEGVLFEKLPDLQIDRLTAVSFDGNKVSYYQKGENGWESRGDAEIINDLGERNAAKYAAIFAKDGPNYECNMEKAFKRLKYLIQVYGGTNINLEAGGKLLKIIDATEEDDCKIKLESDVKNRLGYFQISANVCAITGYGNCLELIERAGELDRQNRVLTENDCITLY